MRFHGDLRYIGAILLQSCHQMSAPVGRGCPNETYRATEQCKYRRFLITSPLFVQTRGIIVIINQN